MRLSKKQNQITCPSGEESPKGVKYAAVDVRKSPEFFNQNRNKLVQYQETWVNEAEKTVMVVYSIQPKPKYKSPVKELNLG